MFGSILKCHSHKKSLWAVAFFCLSLALFWLVLKLLPCPHPLAGVSFSQMFYDRNGELLRISLSKDQKYRCRLKLDDLPEYALERIVRYEDSAFWMHPGVNPFSLLRAAFSSATGQRRVGGSTLTMQTARLAYGLKTSTILGKVAQILWALRLERHYSKAEILEAYFNLAPYGGNVEGLAGAAYVYLHKPPQRLTREETEALMLVPQNPVQRRPSPANKRLQKAMARIWHEGEEVAPLRFFGVQDLPFLAPHLTTELLADESLLAKTRIDTTIEKNKQQLLEEDLTRFCARLGAFGIKNAAALLVHWPTMEVRALAGSAAFANVAIAGQIDGTRVRRSPGSTLKPFIYALALEQGKIHPRSILADTPRSFQGYDPENFDHSFRGPIAAEEALRASRNVPAISLAGSLKNPDLYGFLEQGGVAFLQDRNHYGLALVLGGAEVTMRELAVLYAMLANKGVSRPLRMEMHQALEPGKILLSQEAAFVTLAMLKDPLETVQSRKGERLNLYTKTGTSNGFRDAWTCGLLGPYVLIVWVGNFDNSSNPLLVGGRVAYPLFMEIAKHVARTEALKEQLSTPSPQLSLLSLPVCRKTGDLDVRLCQETVTTWFISGISPVKPTGILRPIDISLETGLRACYPKEGKTKRVVWEFWPSDLADLFAQAGQPKPAPPPFEPECEERAVGRGPILTRPKQGLIYYARLSGTGRCAIPLAAKTDAEGSHFTWYIDGIYFGASQPGETLTWQARPGQHSILCVDEFQRTTTQKVTVHAIP